MGECKAGEKHREIFLIFHEIFHEIFQAKKFPEILHHYQLSTLCSRRRLLFLPPQICSERNYVTYKPETENRFWPFPKPKNRFYKRNPVLETLTPSGTRRQKNSHFPSGSRLLLTYLHHPNPCFALRSRLDRQ